MLWLKSNTGGSHLEITNQLPLQMPAARKQLMQPSRVLKGTPPANPWQHQPARSARTVCYTVSGRNFLNQDSLMLWTGEPTLTRDGNVIVSGEYADYSKLPSLTSGGFCMKTDTKGNVIWAKLYDSLGRKRYGFTNFFCSLELKNGSILLAGRTNNNISGNNDFILAKLDRNGNLNWTKTYQSRLWQGFNGSGDYFNLTDLEEDTTTGEIYFVGGHWFSAGAVTKVHPNDGRILWSHAFDSFDSDYPFGIVIRDNHLLLFQLGISYSSLFVTGVSKATGDSLFNKQFRYSGTPNSPAIYNAYEVMPLDNGHFLLSGPTTGYWEYPAFTGTKDMYHAGIVELDENLNFVKGYGFKNRWQSNGYNTQVSLYPDGTGVFSMLYLLSGYDGNAHISLFRDGQIYHQRKRLHRNEGMPHEPPTLRLPDGGFLNIKLMGDSTKLATDGARIDYYRMHITDTASDCLGLADSSTSFWYFNYEPAQGSMDSIKKNMFGESLAVTYTSWDMAAAPGPACEIVSHCDTLALKLSSTNICPGSGVTLTIQKDAACGGLVPLSYDTNWVSAVKRLTDTTYAIRFSQPGSGYIRASMMGCQLHQDSVFLQVLEAPATLDLGLEKELCPGNTIMLNARRGYATYRWQDGSTDSTLKVTQPGLYFVTTTDACGGIYKDSVLVKAAPPIPFSAGPDRTKCNADTLHLTAPPDFLNYVWGNNYNINSLTAQSVVVSPLTDTAYYVKAEKTPGCFAYDTVRVSVYHSPEIDLGPDRRFCTGDSAQLNAGSGFVSYNWNGGQTAQQVTVKTAGQYSVTGTTAEGCKSADTIKVLEVFPLPQVSLNKDNDLCTGESKILNAGSFAAYQWNTGATTSTITVQDLGSYAVTVTDQNGCKGSDTTRITEIHPTPQRFLPPDTLICSYGSLQLTSTWSYNQYRWNTGATNGKITITQPGTYWLEVIDGEGCVGRDSVTVGPKDCLSGFYAPSAFSPNSDGKNDLFRPLLFGRLKSYRFTVYNRWGQMVYQTTELSKGWNGKVGGVLQQSDVYVWVCTYQFEGSEPKKEKGTVLIMR
jgi:gliding motility-associated-like protein